MRSKKGYAILNFVNRFDALGDNLAGPPFRHRLPAAGKLYVPPRRLLEKIRLPSDGEPLLVNLVAPAGYGKTNLAAALVRDEFDRIVWLNLQEEDSVRPTLIEDLQLSLNSTTGTLADKPPPERIAELGRICVVLDNLHHLAAGDAPLIEEIFASLAAGSILITCADEDHALPLSRLRMEERVVELRVDELAANTEETALFFERLGAPIDSEELHRLLKKSNGWWACIRLFGLTWQKSPPEERSFLLDKFTGTDRFIAEFLSELIDKRLSPPERKLMQALSVCTSTSERLAASLIPILNFTPPDSLHGLFRNLESRYLLIPSGQGWYRTSPLLRQYYKAGLDGDIRRRLHVAAADWYEEAGMEPQARRHRTRSLPPGGERPPSPLQKRESEILSLVAEGCSNAEIGARLFISAGTVKWHMNRILEKLECPNRISAAELARKRGYLPRS